MAGMVRPRELYSRMRGTSQNDFSNLVTKKAEKKSFLISLPVQGYLDSLGNSILSSAVEGTTTIIKIVPEGTIVKKDDIVCELDASSLRDKAKQQEITVNTADSAEVKAKTTLDETLNQGKRDIQAAIVKMTVAQKTVTKYKEGEFPQQTHELEASIELANEELVRANDNYEFTKQQVKKGYRTQNELEANRIAKKQSEFKVKSAVEKLKVLKKFDYETKVYELESSATELALELESVKLKATLAETQAKSDYETQKLTSAVEHEKYDRMKNQIEACIMKAPQDGQVVYAVMQSSGRSQGETIEQGATVRERQAIINLPDITQMKVDCRIHESLIGNIRLGLPAYIKVSTSPDRVFKGVVTHVSSVPMSGRWPNMDLKEYETEIKLTDAPEIIQKLRPGLTAQVEIMIDSREDVLQVPVQAVLAVGNKQIAYVLTPAGEERRELVVGQSNQSHVEIKSGVENGELVIMNARSQFSDKIAAFEAEQTAEQAKNAVNEKIPPVPAGPAIPASPAAGAPVAGGPVGGGPGAAGGPGSGGGPGAGGAGGGPGGGGFDPAAMFARMDANSDGKLAGDEINERMKDRVAAMDKDSDGAISKDEFLSAPRGPRGGGGSGGGPGAGGGGSN